METFTLERRRVPALRRRVLAYHSALSDLLRHMARGCSRHAAHYHLVERVMLRGEPMLKSAASAPGYLTTEKFSRRDNQDIRHEPSDRRTAQAYLYQPEQCSHARHEQDGRRDAQAYLRHHERYSRHRQLDDRRYQQPQEANRGSAALLHVDLAARDPGLQEPRHPYDPILSDPNWQPVRWTDSRAVWRARQFAKARAQHAMALAFAAENAARQQLGTRKPPPPIVTPRGWSEERSGACVARSWAHHQRGPSAASKPHSQSSPVKGVVALDSLPTPRSSAALASRTHKVSARSSARFDSLSTPPSALESGWASELASELQLASRTPQSARSSRPAETWTESLRLATPRATPRSQRLASVSASASSTPRTSQQRSASAPASSTPRMTPRRPRILTAVRDSPPYAKPTLSALSYVGFIAPIQI